MTRPESIDPILGILEAEDIEVISITSVEGVGRQRGHTEIFRGREYAIVPRPKVKLEFLVENILLRDRLIKQIRDQIHTGRVGDGKVFVFQVMVPDEDNEQVTGTAPVQLVSDNQR